MLKKIIKIYRDDSRSEEWIYFDNDNPQPPIQLKGTNIKHTISTTWFYHVEDLGIPPSIATIKDKTYIMPHWIEVHPQTTLHDIKVKKKRVPKKDQTKIIKTFTSGSSDSTYTTTYYKESGKYFCDCPGFWRSGGNCKHVKQLKLENND